MSTITDSRAVDATAGYTVTGMTCGGCAVGVKSKLESLPEVESADVQLAGGAVRLWLKRPVEIEELQSALGSGKYRIAPSAEVLRPDDPAPSPATAPPSGPQANFLSTYRPLLLIVGFIAGVTLLAQWPLGNFDGTLWMRHFMAGFFIVFSFFKLLNLRGFAESYAMYDIVAGRWRAWGYVYPFVELGLGLAYLTNVAPFWTNVATIVVLGVSAIGVIRSVLSKQKIRCACLGDVFNLPMSTVTIVEDVGMVTMAALMLA